MIFLWFSCWLCFTIHAFDRAVIASYQLTRTVFPLSAENNLLTDEIRRLENAIQSTEVPLHIARDCLAGRQRRVDSDLVQDNAEIQLLKVKNCVFLRKPIKIRLAHEVLLTSASPSYLVKIFQLLLTGVCICSAVNCWQGC